MPIFFILDKGSTLYYNNRVKYTIKGNIYV